MTASKATFFPRGGEDDWPGFGDFRSSSSHYAGRIGDGTETKFDLGLNMGFGGESPSMPIPQVGLNTPRNAASPFASHSLPKFGDGRGMPDLIPTASMPNGLNFAPHGMQYVPDGDTNMAPLPKMLPTNTISNSTSNGTSNPSARTSSSDEQPSTPASTSSIRRKLSLTWKRSSSKASARVLAALAAEKEEREKDNKRNEMPPPKLPASATWTTRTSSDAGSSARPSLDVGINLKSARTRKSSNSLSQGSMDVDTESNKESLNSTSSNNTGSEQTQKKSVPRSSSTSILTPVQRMLGGKGSLTALRGKQHQESHTSQCHSGSTPLDKDDAAADRVMEKLASKRKDFAEAAREVDSLRSRAIPAKGYSPNQAIYSANLNIFERGEIVDYKEVFFAGTKHAKKIVGDLDQAGTNFGYDDERGDYNIVLSDHLAYRYEVIDLLGKGSFGQVVRCIDHKLGVLVAVKIIRNKKRFHQQALVEVNILQKLREWVSFPFCCA
jgi:dual specificity tyrosine-phosphorylation-regulated kinase 2/3/4